MRNWRRAPLPPNCINACSGCANSPSANPAIVSRAEAQSNQRLNDGPRAFGGVRRGGSSRREFFHKLSLHPLEALAQGPRVLDAVALYIVNAQLGQTLTDTDGFDVLGNRFAAQQMRDLIDRL